MIYEKILLSEKYPDANLTVYVSGNPYTNFAEPRAAVIVCPGGGYSFVSPREAEPVVKKFFAEGYNVYLLNYSVGEKARDFAPLIEAALAIKYVRENAASHKTDPNRIFIIGFSAGGHLAASSGILWNIKPVRDALGITEGKAPEGINKPDGMILSYPVITGGQYRHKGSIANICGKADPTDEERDVFSLEKHVDATSARFIWHTVTDKSVPIQNTLLIDAYVANSRPIEHTSTPQESTGFRFAPPKPRKSRNSSVPTSRHGSALRLTG